MSDPEQRILAYPHLSREEQQAVEAYVDDHPEWKSLLRDVKSVEGLAAQARRFDKETPADRVLATYVVMRRLHPEDIPPSLEQSFQRIEDRLETDEALRARREKVLGRVRSFEDAIDPVDHLRRLGGPDLRDIASDDPDLPAVEEEPDEREPAEREPAQREPVAAARFKRAEREAAPDRPPEPGSEEDRDPASRISGSRLTRWSVALVAVLLVGYGGLFLVSRAAQSPVERLAAMRINPDVVDSYRVPTRGAPPQSGPSESGADSMTADAIYLEALPLLQEARTSTLGLFPRYDPARLAEAESMLQTVVERTRPGSFLQLEARFYLGKVNLAQNEVETARSHLKAVASGQSRRSEQAVRILQRLQEEVPAAPEPAS